MSKDRRGSKSFEADYISRRVESTRIYKENHQLSESLTIF